MWWRALLFSLCKFGKLDALKNNFESMLQKITEYFPRREFVSYSARCGVALAAVTWIHPYILSKEEIIEQTDAEISLRIANFVILQALLTGNVFFSGQFKRSICWLGLKEIELQIESFQTGRTFLKFFSEANKKIHRFLAPVVDFFPFPFSTNFDDMKTRVGKAFVRACTIEVIFRGGVQEVLLRQAPKYLFAASRFIPSAWVDACVFQIARIFLSSLIYAIFRSSSNRELIRETVSGAFSGYLAETGGLSFSLIQRFSEYYYEEVKNLPRPASSAPVRRKRQPGTASCVF